MSEESSISTSDIILYLLIISLIAMIVIAVSIYEKDAYQCLQDPIQYYKSIKNVSCNCLSYEVDLSKPFRT